MKKHWWNPDKPLYFEFIKKTKYTLLCGGYLGLHIHPEVTRSPRIIANKIVDITCEKCITLLEICLGFEPNTPLAILSDAWEEKYYGKL